MSHDSTDSGEPRDACSHWNRLSEQWVQWNSLRLLTEPVEEGRRERKLLPLWLYNVRNWRGTTKEKRPNEILPLTEEQQADSLFLILFNFLCPRHTLTPPPQSLTNFCSFVNVSILKNNARMYPSLSLPNEFFVCFSPLLEPCLFKIPIYCYLLVNGYML
jgi:hypothetical protein